jgi:hypothetical protein
MLQNLFHNTNSLIMNRVLILWIGILFSQISIAQTYFRSGIFLHHSTGNYIWGPNPDGKSTTTIPLQMSLYNSSHSYSGSNSITLNEEWWSPSDNEWSTQHQFFEGNTAYTNIKDYLSNHKIIVIKSCFPASSIEAWGVSSDTLNPSYKSVYNYKWHWRHIVKVMASHPDHFFALWTNAPLEPSSTNSAAAEKSLSFCKWAKDTLAKGLDATFGKFPANVYVFNFFSKLTDANGMMLTQYRTSAGDSHPNGAATDLVAPQFVKEIFDAAIVYESTYTDIPNCNESSSTIRIKPNPATDKVEIAGQCDETIEIINTQGETVQFAPLSDTHTVDITHLAKGIYFLRIKTGKNYILKKLIKQ